MQLACLDKDLTAPPASPAEGDRYLVTAASPGGAWAGLSGQIVRLADGVWTGTVPRPGFLAYVLDEADLYVFTGSAWASFRSTLTALQNLTRLGVGTAADASNRFAVKADAALLSWDDVTPGSGHMRVSLNKQAAARDAGFVFQTGYSTRALFGTLGSDDVTLKTSADGTSFATALTASTTAGVDLRTGETTLAAAATVDLGAAPSLAVLITGTSTITGFGTVGRCLRLIRFAGALTLTHNATSLALPGAANLLTAAGDTAIATSDASGNWRVRHYARASGKALVGPAAGEISDGSSVGRSVLTAASAAAGASALGLGGGDSPRWAGGTFTGNISLTTDYNPSIQVSFRVYGDAAKDWSVINSNGTLSLSAAASATFFQIAPGGSTKLTLSTGLLSLGVPVQPAQYTVATLPSPGTPGRLAYCSNARMFNGTGTLEASGAGTGGLVVDNGAAWKIAGTNVTASA